MAKGLDCGTSFYIAATEDTIKKQRNAFLTVDGEVTQVKRMLKRQGIPYVEKNKKILMDKPKVTNLKTDEVIKGKVKTQKDKLKQMRGL